jgi:hypothetical protein
MEVPVTAKIRRAILTGLCLAAVSAPLAIEAEAQGRAVRRPPARVAPARRVVVVTPRYYYRPYYYSPFYWSAFGWYPAGFYPPPYYWDQRYGYYYTGAVRIQAAPREAEVYVDGYLVGIVDDFDGAWQRLRLPGGEHDLELYLEGHRPFRQTILVRPGATVKIAHTMEPLAPGETLEPRPRPDTAGAAQAYPPGPEGPERPAEPSTFGAVAIRVQPADAEVLIDGERWEWPAGEARLVVELAPGPHRVEIRREGYRHYTTTIEVRRGDTVTLNVSLPRGS